MPQLCIRYNNPTEENLHVIMVLSNPCQYKRRFVLATEFIHRMQTTENVVLYVVEMAYGDQVFQLSQASNPRHLQLRTEHPIWHKENMINLGVGLLPPTWKAMAWIDADIEFENPSWAKDTLKILHNSKDVVQLFSHAVNMERDESAIAVFPSFGYQHQKKQVFVGLDVCYWHPGYAWACTRQAYDTMGGLFESSIIGASDFDMALAFAQLPRNDRNALTTPAYVKVVKSYTKKCQLIRLGYVPGVVRHHFHGSMEKRQYKEVWDILITHKYNPSFITRNEIGILVPTIKCPPGLLSDILHYFQCRKEDD